MSCTTDSTPAGPGFLPPALPPQRVWLNLATSVSRRRRIATTTAAAMAMICTLTACSLPNLSMSPNVGKAKTSATTSQTSTPSSHATPSKPMPSFPATTALPRAAGDLDTGSVTHKIAVGAFSAVIVYYTADNAKLYRDSSTKTIRIAVHIEGAGARQTILVNNLVATADDDTTRAIVKQDPRSFAITPPQSYNTVVTIPATADESAVVTLIVELDFSVQITPTSTLYAAQTALDSITLPLLTGSQS
jgi:hypothetical protein